MKHEEHFDWAEIALEKQQKYNKSSTLFDSTTLSHVYRTSQWYDDIMVLYEHQTGVFILEWKHRARILCNITVYGGNGRELESNHLKRSW